MLKLRDYQRDAIDALYDYWGREGGSPLIVVPTGGGKSLILATICQELIRDYPDMRIMIVTHVKELIESNYRELVGIWPLAPAGIYSAGLGRRDAHAQILFAGVQTISRKATNLGHFDLVMVDEAHLLPRNAETQYGQLLAGLRSINQDLRLVGMTATPFRLGEGLLTEGDGAIFDAIAYEKPIGEMIEEKWLSRPISKGMATRYDLTGVGKLGGDYKQNALQAAVDKFEVTRAAIDEVCAYGHDRKTWLLFCSGLEHAYHVRDEIRSRGISCETVAGETPSDERRRILEEFKAGRIRAVTNNAVMTTGTNIPGIDLLAMMRPTLSASLYVQMIGRGLRLAPGKENCLVLDFAGNVSKHGPIDAVTPSAPRSGTGEAPVRLCPRDGTDPTGRCGCGSINHASARVCVDCGFIFPEPEKEEKLSREAEYVPVLSTEGAAWATVKSRTFRFHPPKIESNPPSVKVTYMVGMKTVNEWVCPQHMEHPNPRSRQFPKTKADRFWRQHGGALPCPTAVDEWLSRQGELLPTAEIQLDYSQSSKYPDVKGHRPGARVVGDDAANDNVPWNDADEIPF
ncbi:DEAD/DEAH box helicase [Consotaella salsifontis]|uniref:DNA repair protein RadD n=1 Tax=Consotaella salsifontis TaxID=1365950 RepID=A0A1T4RWP0_9HYPH|nr:DEAD/DEAH box helicase [Consotaella salsifontis]SKA20001.1 DNA repair protein RadD [Consotaella salsifontis]